MSPIEPVFEKPDKRILRVWVLSSLFSYGLMSLILVPIASALSRGLHAKTPYLILLFPVALLTIALTTLVKTYNAWGYRLTDKTLEIRKGWIWKSHRVVSRDRIQHVDINSGPLDRHFGLVQVVVYTAGTVVGLIPGLSPLRAENLRKEFSATMKVQ